MRYDVAVIGLGGMGSAILAECACRGSRVIGLDNSNAATPTGLRTGRPI